MTPMRRPTSSAPTLGSMRQRCSISRPAASQPAPSSSAAMEVTSARVLRCHRFRRWPGAWRRTHPVLDVQVPGHALEFGDVVCDQRRLLLERVCSNQQIVDADRQALRFELVPNHVERIDARFERRHVDAGRQSLDTLGQRERAALARSVAQLAGDDDAGEDVRITDFPQSRADGAARIPNISYDAFVFEQESRGHVRRGPRARPVDPRPRAVDVEWLPGRDQTSQGALGDGLDDVARTIAIDDGLVAGQFHFTRDAHGLIAAVLEESDVA